MSADLIELVAPVTTASYIVTWSIDERNRQHVVSVVARIIADEIRIGSVQLFLDDGDGAGGEPQELGRDLDARELAYVAGQVVEMHRRDKREEAADAARRCPFCGSLGNMTCAIDCHGWLPW